MALHTSTSPPFLFNLSSRLSKSSLEPLTNLNTSSSPDINSAQISSKDIISSITFDEEHLSEENTFGSEVWCGEAKYTGCFKDSLKHGFGILQFKDGLHYKGQFQEDNISGYGIASWPDKTYEGFWNNNQKHGKGKEFYKDGKSYIGEFSHDRKQGYGEFFWANGSSFTGNFINGKQHGEGIFTSKNGTSKRGLWENGKRIAWIEESYVAPSKINQKEENCNNGRASLLENDSRKSDSPQTNTNVALFQ